MKQNGTWNNFSWHQEESRYINKDFVKDLPALIVPLAFHFLNISVILGKKKLHKPEYWFLLNLSLSDSLQMLATFYRACDNGTWECDTYSPYVLFIKACFYIVSVLSTFGISVDRYISVEYSLRYHTIVTGCQVVKSIALIWITSIIFAFVISTASATLHNWAFYNFPQLVVRIVLSLALMTSGFHVRNVRNKHEQEILKRQRYFGLEEEQLGLLRSLKESVIGVLRLNVTTAVLCVFSSILEVVWLYGYLKDDHVVYLLIKTVYGTYLFSNPFLYIITMSQLRKEYVKIFRQIFHRPVSTVSPEMINQRRIINVNTLAQSIQ